MIQATSTPEWLREILKNKTISDICINGPTGVFVDQGQGMIQLDLANSAIKNEELKRWILSELEMSGGTWDAKRPYINLILSTGHRAHAIFPPLSQQGVMISLRRLVDRDRYRNSGRKFGVERWRETQKAYLYLRDLVKAKQTLIVSGGTGSGKTTLVNDLLEEIVDQERIIALEDTPELFPCHPHFLSLVSRSPNADGYGGVTLRDLLKETLRMRPDRIILGECRGIEVLELLQALNTGHEGSLATIHAGSARKTLDRIELLAGISSEIPITVIRGLLAGGVQSIAQVRRINDIRMISEVHEVTGIQENQISLKQIF